MALVKAAVCDVCGKQKNQVNCWWLVSVDGALHLEPWSEDWEEADKHLCGQECVIKAVNEYLSGGK